MAYSKIKPIRTRLDRCVDYVIDPEKTALAVAMDYIENSDKNYARNKNQACNQ